MQAGDREEFEAQVKLLCAGYDRPVADRLEAYWKGLGKMAIIEFARVVEFAIGEDGPEKLPDTHACWRILKQLKTRASKPPAMPALPKAHLPDDHLAFFANRILLRHVIWRGGIGERELTACLKVKAAVVREFAPFVIERDELATKGEFLRRLTMDLDRASPLNNLPAWQRLLTADRGADLFPANAADGINPSGTLDL
jgi:hypothetical protein